MAFAAPLLDRAAPILFGPVKSAPACAAGVYGMVEVAPVVEPKTACAPGGSTVTHHDENGTWIIALDGEHDISTTSLLDEQISSLLACCTRAVVDLSSTTFIDASVIGWLMRTRGLLAMSDGALSVVQGNPGGVAERVFDVLRLHDELSVYSTQKDALAREGAA